jgi:hypothetical protein
MTPDSNALTRVIPAVLRAAVGLAAEHFPALGTADWPRLTTRRHVQFVLDGHVDAWQGWSGLAEADAQRFGRLLRRRPNVLANAEVCGPLLDEYLLTDQLPGCAPAEGYAEIGLIAVSPGMPLREYVDASLDFIDQAHAQNRCMPDAAVGSHHTTIRVPGPGGTTRRLEDVRYTIRPRHLSGTSAFPAISDADPLPHLRVPFAELASIAARLDAADKDSGGGYRTGAVARFADQVRDQSGPVQALDLAAGPLNGLLAYTGFGKSVVLVETFACWAAQRGVVVSFVVPTNADVVRYAHRIERSLAALGSKATVTPLMSPRSVFKVAETSAHRAGPRGPAADWIWTRLGYGCALAAAADAESGIDAWQPGDEPCTSLTEPRRGRAKDRVVACPFRPDCGKFRLARAACTADIIITSHANMLTGRLHAPVDDGAGITDRVTVEELLIRRSHVIVIDEADSFQRSAIDKAGRGLMLDLGGSIRTPLRQFDEEFKSAFGRMRAEVDASVRDAFFQTSYLATAYVSHLHFGRLGAARPERRRRPGPARHWVVPRRWDAWLAAKLFRLPEDAPVSQEQMNMLRSLFPDSRNRRPDPAEPGMFALIRPLLRDVVTSGVGAGAVTGIRAQLDHLLEGTVGDQDRHLVINRMLRRAILEQIRNGLYRLMTSAPQLEAAGVDAMRDIADALGVYTRWRATPTGPLGRLMFAFTEHHDDTGNEPTQLSTAAFGGDPHTYTVTLGDITALAHAGARRIVLGMSATSFFPLAPHHHVHARPRWWVRDDNPGTVTVVPSKIHRDGELINVSGKEGRARADNTRLLAQRLWTAELDAELQRLCREDPARARILLATTSYEAGRHAAEGLSAAGVAPSRICLAVRPRADDPYDPDSQAITSTGPWLEIPADRLEEFPAVETADILIAPLARVQRGINIIGEGDKSALGSVWLLVRPIPVIDEPAELVAHIQARALAHHPGPAHDPVTVLDDRRSTTGLYFEDIVRRPPYFQAQPATVKLSVTAEIIISAIQLIGRARRGGTSAALHLVDGAFHDASTGTDFATLVTRLRSQWHDDKVIDDMRAYYGTTLEAFFAYAEANLPQPAPGAAPC